jgi:hypothetical protein
MRARLVFPAEVIDSLKRQGLRQRSPERLRWTDQHLASGYGNGVLLRGKSSDVLDGFQFRALRNAFGAWIETDNKERVACALGVPWQGGFKELGIKDWPSQ